MNLLFKIISSTKNIAIFYIYYVVALRLNLMEISDIYLQSAQFLLHNLTEIYYIDYY